MSVRTHIRFVGTIATSIASALGLFAIFWLVSFFDLLPGIQSAWLVGTMLMGLPLLATMCVVLALSIDASQRRPQSDGAAELTRHDGGTLEVSAQT